MALLEQEATRFAESLDDYEHVSVTDIGGWGPIGFWVVVRDNRFDLDYEITSHCDYWYFIGAVVDHRQCGGHRVTLRPCTFEGFAKAATRIRGTEGASLC